MADDTSADAQARLERALDRLERATQAALARKAKAPALGAKDRCLAEVRARLDAAIADIDSLLGP